MRSIGWLLLVLGVIVALVTAFALYQHMNALEEQRAQHPILAPFVQGLNQQNEQQQTEMDYLIIGFGSLMILVGLALIRGASDRSRDEEKDQEFFK